MEMTKVMKWRWHSKSTLSDEQEKRNKKKGMIIVLMTVTSGNDQNDKMKMILFKEHSVWWTIFRNEMVKVIDT